MVGNWKSDVSYHRSTYLSHDMHNLEGVLACSNSIIHTSYAVLINHVARLEQIQSNSLSTPGSIYVVATHCRDSSPPNSDFIVRPLILPLPTLRKVLVTMNLAIFVGLLTLTVSEFGEIWWEIDENVVELMKSGENWVKLSKNQYNWWKWVKIE